MQYILNTYKFFLLNKRGNFLTSLTFDNVKLHTVGFIRSSSGRCVRVRPDIKRNRVEE